LGSAIGSSSVRQSRGAVNEILIVQIASAVRGFHAHCVEILRGSARREKLFCGFMDFFEKKPLASAVLTTSWNWY
jgi:hypothetical protein